jgi:phosphate acetyltransferase
MTSASPNVDDVEGLRDALRARWDEGSARIAVPEVADERVSDSVERYISKYRGTVVTPSNAQVQRGSPHDPVPATEASVISQLSWAADCLRNGSADGVVAGAVATTREVFRHLIRPNLIKGPDVVASQAVVVVTRDHRVLMLADVTYTLEPTATQLARIATDTAVRYRQLVGDEPRVALLSHSTLGSGATSAALPRLAVDLARDLDPTLIIDGEIQADVALSPTAAKSKGVLTETSGRSNVLIFPNIDAGNIAYKLIEVLGGAMTICGVPTGLARPIVDMSRSFSADQVLSSLLACNWLASSIRDWSAPD